MAPPSRKRSATSVASLALSTAPKGERPRSSTIPSASVWAHAHISRPGRSSADRPGQWCPPNRIPKPERHAIDAVPTRKAARTRTLTGYGARRLRAPVRRRTMLAAENRALHRQLGDPCVAVRARQGQMPVKSRKTRFLSEIYRGRLYQGSRVGFAPWDRRRQGRDQGSCVRSSTHARRQRHPPARRVGAPI